MRRNRKNDGAGRLVSRAGRADLSWFEGLEHRLVFNQDVTAIRLTVSASDLFQVGQWIAEVEDAGGGGAIGADKVFKVLSEEFRLPGPSNFIGAPGLGWESVSFFDDGRTTIDDNGTIGAGALIGQSFYNESGYGLGWSMREKADGSMEFYALHELPDGATLADVVGEWTFVAIAIPTSGSASGASIEGAYGHFEVLNSAGSYDYHAEVIGEDAIDGSGVIKSMLGVGLGSLGQGAFFSLSRDKNVITAVDLSHGDGTTYIAVAVRQITNSNKITEAEVAGEYRVGHITTGASAERRGESKVAFESLYIDIDDDGSFEAYDLADHDRGTETEVYTGSWTLLPDGRSLSLNFESIEEVLLASFSTDHKTFLGLRVTGDSIQDEALTIGVRVDDSDASDDDDNNGGGGGGGGNDDDNGLGEEDEGNNDDGSDDTLINPTHTPRVRVPGRAGTGRQAIWEFGTDRNWYFSKVGVRTEAFDLNGELVVWEDDFGTYAAGSSDSGLILFTRGTNNKYTKRNITEELSEGLETPEKLVGQVTLVQLPDLRYVILGLSEDGDVLAYVQQGLNENNEAGFFYVNLSQEEIRDKDRGIPALTGTLIAGVTKWETILIGGLDKDGQLWSLWYDPTNAGWRSSPLGDISDSPAMAGSLALYVTPWNGINFAGLTEDGTINVVWWVPSFGGTWKVSNLTEMFDGPSFKVGSLTSYITPWNALTLAGITEAGELTVYWWVPGFDDWVVTDLTDHIPKHGAKITQGKLFVVQRTNKDIWIFGRSTANEFIRFAWSKADDDWSSQILSDGAGQF